MGEGGFTVAREQALLKLANYQLPFEGAWGMKVVQAAVAWEQSSEIKVTISRTEAFFAFQCPEELSLEEIENAFYNPEPHPDRAVRHLVSALWAVGIAKKHPFVLSFPHQESSLRWNGKELSYGARRVARSWSALLVGGGADPRSLNASLSQCLAQRCYTCPVPLTVDGRRLDGLQYCPSHGWSGLNYPLALVAVSTDLPSLPIPSGTWQGKPSKEWQKETGEGLGETSNKVMEQLTVFDEATCVFLLAAHVQSHAPKRYEPRFAGSQCYWVSDGVVVEQRELDVAPGTCSAALILSGQGLPTDLSGLSLAQSEESQRRLAVACRAVGEELKTAGLDELHSMVKQGETNSKVVGGAFLLAGSGLFLVNPLLGAMVGSFLVAAGVVSMGEGGALRASWTENFQEGLKNLAADWQEAYPAE